MNVTEYTYTYTYINGPYRGEFTLAWMSTASIPYLTSSVVLAECEKGMGAKVPIFLFFPCFFLDTCSHLILLLILILI